MKIAECKYLWIALLLALAVNVYQYKGNGDNLSPQTTIDTIKTVIIDSISLIRAKAELNYLREELKNAEGKIEYIQKVDTITVNSVEFIVPNFTARIDTTFEQEDYLTALYEYPQNRFTILHKYPITNTQVSVTEPLHKSLFSFNHGLTAGLGYGVISQKIDLFVGYGFTIGLNL